MKKKPKNLPYSFKSNLLGQFSAKKYSALEKNSENSEVKLIKRSLYFNIPFACTQGRIAKIFAMFLFYV